MRKSKNTAMLQKRKNRRKRERERIREGGRERKIDKTKQRNIK